MAAPGVKKDKKKIIGEAWSDERIAGFLGLTPADDCNPDFYVLERAYQSMRDDDFARFIAMFNAAGRNINAVGPLGLSILDIADQHRNSGEIVDILKQAGATLHGAAHAHTPHGKSRGDVDLED